MKKDIADRLRAVNVYVESGDCYMIDRFFIEILNDHNKWVRMPCIDRSDETGKAINIRHPPWPAKRLATAKIKQPASTKAKTVPRRRK